MGTSEVSYRGRSFEAPDPVLEAWLRLLVDEVDALNAVPTWLRTARDQWQLIATQEFGFGVIPDLDGVLTDEERRKVVLALAHRALARLESFGDPIPAKTLNRLGAGKPDSAFSRDVSAEVFLMPARAFIALLASPSARGGSPAAS